MKKMLLITLLTFVNLICAFAQFQNISLSQEIEPASFKTVLNQKNNFELGWKQFRPLTLDPSILNGTGLDVGDTLTLNLFNDKIYTSTIISRTVDVNGVVTLVSHFTKYHYAYCFISVSEGKAAISIEIPDLNQFYVSRYVSNGNLYLIQIDENNKSELEGGESFMIPKSNDKPLEKSPMKLQKETKNSNGNKNITSCLGTSDVARINVLIVYTPAANTWSSSNEGGINITIANAIARCNLASTNNNLGIHYNLAHSAQVTYTEVNASTDLSNLTNGNIANVFTLRNTYASDFVVLFSFESAVGGLGWLLTESTGRVDYGFSLTRVQQASWTYTTIHEIAHNMGAHHHKLQNSQPGPTPWSDWSANTWSAGWRWTGTENAKYCDLMTYESGSYFSDGVSHLRVGYFSDPLITYQGIAVGHASDGDNARTLKEVKHFIAQYRDSTTLQYCTAAGGNTLYGISSVQLGPLTQNAGTSPYYDFSNCAANVTVGSPIQVVVGITNSFATQQLRVWVDWNDNKSFSDVGDTVYVSSIAGATQYIFNITPPNGTSAGLKRVRIRYHLTSSGPNYTPCGTSTHGEVQDFTLNVVTSGCQPVSISNDPANQNMCNTGGCYLGVGVTGTNPITFQWQYRNGSSWVNVSNSTPAGANYTGANTASLGVFTITNPGSYEYRCIVTNCSSLSSDTSLSAFVTVYSLPSQPSIINGDTIPCQNTTQWYQLPSDPSATFFSWSFPSDWTILTPTQSIVGWNFDNATKRGTIATHANFIATPYTADTGTVSNINIAPITIKGGAEFSSWVTGVTGSCPSANKWDSGMNLKYWQITCSTKGIDFLKLSSKQRASSTGPKNFKVQYSLDGSIWVDISGAIITVADNFSTGVLSNLDLPNVCSNQDSLRLRWIMTSNVSVGNGTVGSGGTSRIDDIYLIGKEMTSDSVSVTVGTQNGTITGIPMNSCGAGASQNLLVTTISVPVQPSTITGNVQPCQGTTGLTYSVTNVSGVTYTWSVPSGWSITGGQNTNSITLTAGTSSGDITVTPSNSCGNGTARTLAVTTITVPTQPSTVTGNTQPCQGTTGLTYSVTNVAGVTYTWTVPNGWSITGGQNTNSIIVTAGTSSGDITVTPSNTCGNGTARTLAVTTITVPIQPSTITGNVSPCQGTTGLTYSVTNISGVTYTWTVPSGWSIIGGQGSNSITVTAGTSNGDISVTPSNSCGNGTSRTLAVTTITVPTQPSTITGNIQPCQGTTSLTYSVTNISGVTYTWTVPTGWSITGGQNTNTITVTAGTSNGDITVTPSNNCGNGTARTLAVTTTTVPNQPSTITGNIQPCQGTTGLTYSVTNVAGVTYTWSVPTGWSITGGQGTNSITVTAGTSNGDITVTPSNACGNGTTRTLAVTTITVPAQPSTISGNIQPCQGTTNLTYSVTNVSGVTYTWTVPSGWSITSGQGSNSITVTAGTTNGDITVTPSNTCGNGTARTLAITTLGTISQPSEITGNNQPCQGTVGLTYSVTNVSGVTYAWSVPSGWSITGGQNTNSITVTAGTTNGDITVTPSNSCGNGTARTLAVTTFTVPDQPSTISGNVQPCQGTTNLTYSVTNISGVTYTWSVPSGWSITGGQGTNIITITAGTSSGDITVTPSNSCGNGTARSLAVTTVTVPAQPSTISGNVQPCQGTTGLTYSVTNIAGVTYTWTVPTGWSITGGQNTNSITVTAGTSSGDITVTPSNSCGNGTSRTLAVTTITVPAQPSTITGNVQPCQGTTGLTYSVTNVSGVTYTWTVPSGWSIIGGQGSNSITVTAGTSNGDITVTPSNTCGNGTARTLAVSTITIPAQPSTITGNIQPCQGTSGLTYSVTNVSGVTYTWTVPTGWSITGGQGSNSITVTAGTTNGDITVIPSNSCGNGTARTLAVTTITVPAQPSTISGNVQPCQGTTGLTYSVTNIAGVTYTWTLPSGWSITGGQGSNSIIVTAGTSSGDITVTPSNTCGNGTSRTLAVTTLGTISQPSEITGNNQPCQGTTGLTYSVTNVSGVTYTWSVPSGWNITGGQNSNTITVTAGTSSGDITVTPSNSCGNGTARTLAVTNITVPAQPSTISGNVQPCQGTTGLTYSVTNVSGVTYTWTVPTGWSITGGQNTNSITVTAGTTNGDITVTPSNSCGNGTARTIAVTTITVPVQPSTISGNVQPCQGTTGLTFFVTNISGVTYTWTVPSGWSITGGQSTNSITVTAGTSNGDITVTPSNSCGNGTARTLAVTTLGTISQPSEITGNNQPCQGTTGLTYSVTNISGVTYTWSVPSGWSITGGQNTNSITVTAGTSSGDIIVTPSNSCGNGTARTLAVTTITVPVQPSTITGNVQPCQGTMGLTYSVTNISGVTYTWTVPSGWSITGGQSTNSITVTAGTSNGDITVTPSNSCGNGTARTLAVTTLGTISQPSEITGNNQPCQGTTGLTYSVTNVSGVTYTWTVPTGWNITGGQNTNSITVTAGTTSGDITVTPSNSCGNGTARTLAVTTITVPTQPSTITGNIQPCQGATGLTYSVTNVSGVTYTWTVPTGWSITGGQGTNSITVTAGSTSGDITVTPSNSCGNGTARTLAVTTITVPVQPSTISGNVQPCQGTTSLTYSVTNISGVTYTWTVPTGWSITSGQESNSITITAGTTNGDITVTPSNSCGNGTARTLAVSTITVPVQPSTITGNIQPCQGTTGLTYSVTNVSAVTYTWTVPSGWSITGGQGSNSITVTAGTSSGDITVIPSNSCGNGTARTLAVTTITVPAQPSTITGNVQPCQGTTGLTYSVTNISGVTYTWSVPSGWSITGGQGTNSITVTAGTSGGDITVTPSNSCGNGTARTLAVTTITVPDQPSTITGNIQPCQGTTGLTYSVTNVSGVTYTWTVPTGWSITGGQNTNSITVTAGTTNGDITVTPSNSCGNGTARSLAVTTTTIPAQPSTITGNIQPCQGTTSLTYSVTNISGVTYTWTVPSGWSITGGQNTNSITVTAGTTNGDITVTPSNSCGNGTARTLAVTTITVPSQPSTITGNVQPCQGTTGLTYSVTNISGVTYTWTVPTGWSITGGQNSNTITVTAGTSSGDITVIPSNSCGNGTARTLAVTTTTIPAQPSTITGNIQPCQGASLLTYSVTNISGVTYTWTVPSGWSITGGQGSNSITVTAGTANGDITVTPSNTCGNGTARTLAVTTITVPAQSSTISGNVQPCQGTTLLTYSVTNVAGVIYTWTVPTGWSITSGQNTNSITVTAGTTNGDITVTPSNSCGNCTARTLAVTTITVPAQPSAISGNVQPCQGTSGLTYSVTNISGVTYTWTVPSGWNITGGQNTNTITVITGTSNGDITVTPSNTCGNGTARTLAVTTITVPDQPSTITGNIQPCQGATGLTYSVTNISGVTYTWTVPSGWSITGGQGTNSITVTAGTSNGDITVTPSNTCGNGTARTLAVTTLGTIAQPSTISGNIQPCQGTTGLTFSMTNVSGVTYTWTVPSGWSITGGQGSNSITVTAGTSSGDITVIPSNSCGNGTARTLAVTTITVPAQPSTITGNVSPCQNTTGLTYSVTNVSGVTYTWSVPSGWSITTGQNTNTITVTAGTTNGDITVIPSNSCGNGTARTLAVTTLGTIAQPSTISGNVQPCQGTTGLTYSVTNVSGVTYAWTVPNGWSITGGQNTNTITVAAGISSGDITVTPSNSCGNGTARTLAVMTITVPAQPSTITGNIQPCQGTTGLTYSVINVSGVTYTWSLPSGWSITGGQGSNSITVTAGTTSGDITVTPSNSCGNGTARTLAVTTITVPVQPSTITGNVSPCQGTTGLTYSVTNVSGVTYTWTVPTGWSITGGQNTNTIIVTAGTTSGDITLTPSNSCGNGTARSLAVSTITIPDQPSTISGNIQPCQGATGLTYTVTNVSGVNFTWTVPTGWSITGGQSTNSITVTAGTSNGDITVTPSNSCGNGTARTLAVTTASIPVQPTTITGNVSPCQGTTSLTYSVTNVSGVTYAWTVPSGWSITGGQGSNTITVTAGTTNGDITVTPSNSCGNGTARTLSVSTSTVPAQPSTITGNVQPCQGTTGLTYSVTNVSGVTYNWTVPSGWSITGGQGSNNITVTAGTTNGDITVTPNNSCGNGTARTLAVTTITVPTQPSTISGNVQPCQGTIGLTYSVTNLAGVTYTWSVPSGWSITGGQGSNSITVTTGTTNGHITVAPSNSCGNGTARSLAVSTITVPDQPSSITGNIQPCQGATGLTYSVTNIAGVSYTWTVPTGWSITGGQNTNTITVAAGISSGDITVTPSNSCGNGTARTLAVMTITVPAQPSTITGNIQPCQGTTGLTYSVINVSGVTYTWSLPSGWSITGGQGSNSITVTAGSTSGDITVTPSNTCGNGTARSLAVTTITVPTQPSTITGNIQPCQGATETYAINGVAIETYTWSVPSGWSITGGQGTNSITVTAGTSNGDITVTPSNSCGNGTARTLAVMTITVPAQLSTITGNIQPCQGNTGITYSVTNISGVTYTWTVPTGWSITSGQNSNSITLTAGTTNGDISVTPSNSCGNGTVRSLAVTTITVPAQPSTISGNIQPCQGATGLTYSVTNVSGVTYTWTVPSGWSITGGQGSNTITVTAGTTNGDITVTPSNSCGNGTARTLAVSTITVPAQPSTITGNVSPCQGTSGLTYSVTNVAGVTYTWTVPTGWSITGGQNTNTITVTAGTTSGDITVTPNNSCGNGTARTLAVSTITVPIQPSTITGNVQPCQGTTGLTYSVTNVSGVTYTWTVPTGWSITGGQGSNTITVTAGTTNGDITVTPSNTCGNGTARTLAVTTITVPSQPSTITGNVSPCQGITGLTYSVTNVSGVTYTWTVPTGWSITGGQGSNTITVTVGTTNGDISITPSNSCGNGTARTLAVTTIDVPDTPVITYNDNYLSSDAPIGNQWYLNNEPILNAINQTHIPVQNGSYFSIVTINDCMSDTSNLIIVSNVAIQDFELQSLIHLYPNPTLDEVNFVTSYNGIIKYQIQNIQGQLILKGDFENQTTLNFDQMARGFYMVQFEINGKTVNKKLIKQ